MKGRNQTDFQSWSAIQPAAKKQEAHATNLQLSIWQPLRLLTYCISIIAKLVLEGVFQQVSRSQTTFTSKDGQVVQKCHVLQERSCKHRGVGGQKSQKLVNVVCERPQTYYSQSPSNLKTANFNTNYSKVLTNKRNNILGQTISVI